MFSSRETYNDLIQRLSLLTVAKETQNILNINFLSAKSKETYTECDTKVLLKIFHLNRNNTGLLSQI